MSQEHGQQQVGNSGESDELDIDKFIQELIDEGSSERAIIGGMAEIGRTVMIVKVQKAIAGNELPWLVYNLDKSVYVMSTAMVPDVEDAMDFEDSYKRYFWSYVDDDGLLFVLAGPTCSQGRSW